MKLSVIGDEISQDLEEVIDVIKDNKFDGIEIRSVWNTRPDLLDQKQIEKIVHLMKKSSLSIAGFDSPCFKTEIPVSDRDLENARESFLHAINQARLLNSKFVRVFTFYRNGDPSPEKAGQIISDIIKDILPHDIEVYFETGMRTNTPTIQHMLKFLDIIADNRIGIVWDPGNSVFAGAAKKPFPKDYEIGKDIIKHIHVKDPKGQYEYIKLGEGDIPWQSIIRQLLDDSYQGYLSLETHWRKTHILTQAERDNPWFDRFSKGGLETSIECMKILNEYVREENCKKQPL